MSSSSWSQRLKPLAYALYCTVAFVAVIAIVRAYLPYELAVNTTASIPRGLYLAKDYQGEPLVRGQAACFEYRTPAWAQAREYFAEGRRLCKYALGLSGDWVLSKDMELSILSSHGLPVAKATYAGADSRGRDLPQGVLQDGPIPAGKVLMLAPAKTNSLDSRYLGLVEQQALTHTLTPIFLID